MVNYVKDFIAWMLFVIWNRAFLCGIEGFKAYNAFKTVFQSKFVKYFGSVIFVCIGKDLIFQTKNKQGFVREKWKFKRDELEELLFSAFSFQVLTSFL